MASNHPEVPSDPRQLRASFVALKTPQEVAKLIGISYGQLCSIIYAKPGKFPYETFFIPKKNGTLRTISKPHPAVRSLQNKLLPFLTSAYRPKPSAHGFVVQRSIVSNARPHVGKRFILNIDLEDFFPSIHFGRVRGMLMAVPYQLPSSVASVLARICSNEGVLPQGAPTSPIISNMICARMDADLQRLAGKHRCTYSRYADDLTFSTTSRRFPEQLAVPRHGLVGENLQIGEPLIATITANGFRINTAKQRLQPRHHHQEVTGITVNRFLNPRKKLVRQARAMIFAWKKFGLQAAAAEFREKYDPKPRRASKPQPSFIRVVLGKVEHIRNVGGEGHPGYRKLLAALHQADPHHFEKPAEARTWNPRPADTSSWGYLAKRFRNSVFHLEVTNKEGDLQNGTSFLWDAGYLATAHHNLIGPVSVMINGISSPVGAGDQLHHPKANEGVDAALLKVAHTATAGKLAFKTRESAIEIGESVAALGFPTVPMYDSALIVRTGIVEGTAPQYSNQIDGIQVSIKLTGGFSGGPVIDSSGRLVGVVMEATFEKTAAGVPGGEFQHILPARYLTEISKDSAETSPQLPLQLKVVDSKQDTD
ncbi:MULTISPECIES: reverse transcriptase domain-containing protein [Corallococcus]|uniref:reverse transcriptase domain-containing protein n=1 Tax=Corallococcus TaxID=83461 RepID=UPI0013150386|nr:MULTISPECIES: reverse transcriptase domain-containing protein [Corallococcus]